MLKFALFSALALASCNQSDGSDPSHFTIPDAIYANKLGDQVVIKGGRYIQQPTTLQYFDDYSEELEQSICWQGRRCVYIGSLLYIDFTYLNNNIAQVGSYRFSTIRLNRKEIEVRAEYREPGWPYSGGVFYRYVIDSDRGILRFVILGDVSNELDPNQYFDLVSSNGIFARASAAP